MTLEFDPGAYNAAFQAGQNRNQQNRKLVTDSLNQIPATLMDYATQKRQADMQAFQMQLEKQKADREQQTFNTQNSPLVPPGNQPSDSSPMSGVDMGSIMPSFQPSNGPQNGGTASPSPILRSPSPVIDAWNNHPNKMAFAPSQTQNGNSQQNPEQPYLDILHNPSETPARQKLASEALQRITEEEKTPYEIPMLKAGLAKAQAEPGLLGAQTSEASAKAKEAEAQANFMGQTGGKVGEQKLKLQKQFNDENKDTISELKSAQTADGLIESARTNPVAYNALPLKLAKMLTGSSRINIQEISAMGGSKAILDRAAQAANQMANGTITNDNYQFMKNLAKVLIDGNKGELRNAGMRSALQYSRVNGRPSDSNYMDIVGEPYGQETFGTGSSSPSGSSSQGTSGQIGRFKVTVH